MSGAKPMARERLFPLCRSLTGGGCGPHSICWRSTFRSGARDPQRDPKVFDWTVPEEWNIRDAYIAAPDGAGVDFRRSPAPRRLVQRAGADPVAARRTREHLHTLPDQPELIPYRTSYYERTWGFCLSHASSRPRSGSTRGRHRLDPRPGPPHLRRAPGRGDRGGEVLISRLHPALANDNLRGRGRGMRPNSQGRRLALLPLPLRSRDDRPARLAAPNSDKLDPGPARPDAVVHRRLRESHVQAKPPG